MTLERGTLLHKRYRIVEILGQGGMGSVYRAVDENLGVDVALKENLFTTDEYSRQFRLEAVILANLRHPNLPRVSDHFVIGDQGQYLVMDYIEGEDLRQRMERTGTISEDEAVTIGAAMCDALQYLHTRKPPILHRDLKPGNVKITPDGHIFLVDFGLAKVVQGSQATTTGARAMTPGYSPPEQYGTARTDPRTDVYSLGATLYAALCGIIPEDGLARAMDNAQLTPLRKRNPKISKRLAAVIEKSMAIDPAERYQSAEDFKKALLGSKSKTQQITGNYTVSPAPREEDAASADKSATRPPTGRPLLPAEDNGEDKPFKPPRKRRKKGRLLPTLFFLLLIAAGYLVYNFMPGAKEQVGYLLAGTPTFTPTPLPTETQLPTATATLEPTATATLKPTSTPTRTPEPTLALTDSAVNGAGETTHTPLPLVLTDVFAFASDRYGVPQIFTASGDGNPPAPLTNLQVGACQPAWSPDGTKIVFTSPCSGPNDTFESSNLYIINADGSGQALLLPKPGGDYDPAWSPDGTRIAFTSRRLGRPSIFVYTLATQDITPLYEASGNIREAHSPAWSPLSTQIVFVTNVGGYQHIWYMTDTGAKAGELVYNDLTHHDFDPVWSPDGLYIRFSQRLPGSNPWLMQLPYEKRDLMAATHLAFIAPWIEHARYSPDGIFIIYEGLDASKNRDIYFMTADGKNPTRLTTDSGADFDPAWKPAP